MSRYASKELVPVVADDGSGDTVWIIPLMTLGVESAVNDAAYKLLVGAGGKTNQMSMGAYNLALLLNNIKRWEGPGFEGLPFNAKNLAEVGQNDPLMAKVLREIQERNKNEEEEEGESPNLIPHAPNVSANGKSNLPESLPTAQWENMTSTS